MNLIFFLMYITIFHNASAGNQPRTIEPNEIDEESDDYEFLVPGNDEAQTYVSESRLDNIPRKIILRPVIVSSSDDPESIDPHTCFEDVLKAYKNVDDPYANFIDSFENKIEKELLPHARGYFLHLLKAVGFKTLRKKYYYPLKSPYEFCNHNYSRRWYAECVEGLKKISIVETMTGEDAFIELYRNHNKKTLEMLSIFGRSEITLDELKFSFHDDQPRRDYKKSLHSVKRSFELITLFVSYHRKAAINTDSSDLKTIAQYCSSILDIDNTQEVKRTINTGDEKTNSRKKPKIIYISS